MNRRKRRSQQFWQEVLTRYELATGISQKDFAAQHNIPYSTFCARLCSFRRQCQQDTNPLLSESVNFIELPLPSTPTQSHPQAKMIFSNRLSLEFLTLPQPEYIASLLAALRDS